MRHQDTNSLTVHAAASREDAENFSKEAATLASLRYVGIVSRNGFMEEDAYGVMSRMPGALGVFA